MLVGWLFPGQGAQKSGMGKALAADFPAAKEVFQRANEALHLDLEQLCFEGPDEALMPTNIAQPAILTASVAALAAAREALGPELAPPALAAGHSLGEYSALVAANALKFEDAVRLVQLRGQAMQEAVPKGEGSMAAVMGADAETLEELCREAGAEGIVSPANFNAPGQIVVAGAAGAVNKLRTLAKARKVKTIPLKVSAPFHCALMEPAAVKVREALETIDIAEPSFPVIANVDSKPHGAPENIRKRLVEQVASPVQWQPSMVHASEIGVDRFLEFGPGKVLAGLMKRCVPGAAVRSVSEPAGLEEARALLRGEGLK